MKDTDLESHALSSANDGPLSVSHDSPLLALDSTPAVISPAVTRVSDCSLAERTDGIAPKSRTRVRSGTFGGTRKFRKRVVLKNGDCNVLQTNISKRRLRYLQDIFTTLVDVQWRWTLLVFALSFILSWLAFAVIWWLIAFTHGDLELGNVESPNWRPCVVELKSFASCFLFSIETQHTIGYGSRSTTEECPEAIFVMCLQSITGVMIQAFMVGIVFAKMSRPKNRAQTLLFSRNAVVCQRDGHLCLMFRVGDMRKSHIIGARIRAQLIKSRTTKEGETLGMYQHELSVGADSDRDDVFFIWPMTVVHRIDESSPLYDLSAAELLRDRFEIVVILEGCIESTGQTTQARSSYLPGEILWGHRFQSLVSFNKSRAGYEVDYSLFNDTYEVDTPLCSAKALAEFYRIQDELRRSGILPETFNLLDGWQRFVDRQRWLKETGQVKEKGRTLPHGPTSLEEFFPGIAECLYSIDHMLLNGSRLNQSSLCSAPIGSSCLKSRNLFSPCQKINQHNLANQRVKSLNIMPSQSADLRNDMQQQNKLKRNKQISLDSPELLCLPKSSSASYLNIPSRNEPVHCVISFAEL